MHELVTVVEITKTLYNVVFYNGVPMGEFILMEDGYFHYWPSKREGCWEAYAMRAVADKLDEVNKPWHEQIMNDPVFNKGAE